MCGIILVMPKKPVSGGPRKPRVGDRVMVGPGQNEYRISHVYDDTEVNVEIPGTNYERFRIKAKDLNYLDEAPPPAPTKPLKPKINVEEIRERLAATQQSALDHLDGEIAVLKKYLISKGFGSNATGQLDDLLEAEQKRWQMAVGAIESLLER